MNTPLFDYLDLDDSQMLTGPDIYPSLFSISSEWEDMRVHAAEPKTHLDIDPPAPQPTNISSAVAKAPATRREITATGIRKGVKDGAI